jgi:hypothetical protein
MSDLQTALDYACGEGGADCNPIQAGGACYDPQTLFSHVSYAFSSYYAQNGRNYWNCFFGNSSLITITDPSKSIHTSLSITFDCITKGIRSLKTLLCKLHFGIIMMFTRANIVCLLQATLAAITREECRCINEGARRFGPFVVVPDGTELHCKNPVLSLSQNVHIGETEFKFLPR